MRTLPLLPRGNGGRSEFSTTAGTWKRDMHISFVFRLGKLMYGPSPTLDAHGNQGKRPVHSIFSSETFRDLFKPEPYQKMVLVMWHFFF
jgi:hypothetical protein